MWKTFFVGLFINYESFGRGALQITRHGFSPFIPCQLTLRFNPVWQACNSNQNYQNTHMNTTEPLDDVKCRFAFTLAVHTCKISFEILIFLYYIISCALFSSTQNFMRPLTGYNNHKIFISVEIPLVQFKNINAKCLPQYSAPSFPYYQIYQNMIHTCQQNTR